MVVIRVTVIHGHGPLQARVQVQAGYLRRFLKPGAPGRVRLIIHSVVVIGIPTFFKIISGHAKWAAYKCDKKAAQVSKSVLFG